MAQIGGDLSGDFGPTMLAPDSYFVLRNSTTSGSVVTFTGEVIMGGLGLPIMSLSDSGQDNGVGLQRPIEMTLTDSGLVLGAGDELLVWDQTVAGYNRLYSDAIKYLHDGAKWVNKDAPETDAGGDEVFIPGRGFIIRKASGVEEEIDWINLPNYGNN